MKKVPSKSYLAGAVLCLLCLLGIIYYCFFASFSTSDETQYIYIDQNDTADSVREKLKPYGKTGSLFAFSTLARFTGYGDHIRTGKYAIPADENVLTIFRHIKNGRQEPVRLTIPESRTMDRLAGSLSRKLMLDSTVVAILLRDSSFCAQQGYDIATIACLFVPNTYEVYWDVSLEHFMQRMKKEHDRFWEGERTDKAQALGLTPNEVCTIASIIDEETANNAEKPMTLKRIYHDMLEFSSPYNTYKNIGLPPGPIKIASIAGIDAVLNRVEHPYLYMCAKEDFSGTHNFAKTYQEHLKNAARYAKALNEHGIK